MRLRGVYLSIYLAANSLYVDLFLCMSTEQYISFVVVTLLVMVSPGPSVLYCVNNGIKYGVKIASIAILGNVLALSLLVLVSATGLGAILVASEFFFTLLKIIGAAYLFYLGVKTWMLSSIAGVDSGADKKYHKRRYLFREAFMVTATNPKALAYVTALLPQFIHTKEPLVSQLLSLGLTIASLQFSVLVLYAWLSSKVKPWLEQETLGNIFNKLAGTTFMAFGIALVGSAK